MEGRRGQPCAKESDNTSGSAPESLSDIGADAISGSWKMRIISCFAGVLPKNGKMRKKSSRNLLRISSHDMTVIVLLQTSRIRPGSAGFDDSNSMSLKVNKLYFVVS